MREMYLHLGENTVVWSGDILGVFDLDHTTVSKITRDFLRDAQRDGRVISVSMELPKAFVVTDKGGEKTVYLTQLAPSTLYKRAGSKDEETKGI